jgi:hypothetical protein
MSAKFSIVPVLFMLLSLPARADGLREYIYGDTGLIATESADSVCVYSISSSGVNMQSGGGNGTFTVTHAAGNGCSWAATKNVDWITVTGSGTGNGTVSYSVAANTGPARTGVINAGGQIFTVSQAGITCQQSCSYQAQIIVSQTEAECPNDCIQQVLSEYPVCASYPIGACFDLLNSCINSCQQAASQDGASFYQQCTAGCD